MSLLLFSLSTSPSSLPLIRLPLPLRFFYFLLHSPFLSSSISSASSRFLHSFSPFCLEGPAVSLACSHTKRTPPSRVDSSSPSAIIYFSPRCTRLPTFPCIFPRSLSLAPPPPVSPPAALTPPYPSPPHLSASVASTAFMKFPSLLQLSTTLALCVAAAQAADPSPTIGHTAVLVDNTVFIQGGQSTPNTAQSNSFALILNDDKTDSMNGSKLLDITKLSKLSARNFHVAVKSNAGRLVSCGTKDGGPTGTMTCDVFNPRSYTAESLANIAQSAANRGGMALAVGPSSAYILGGSISDTTFSNAVNVLVLSSDLKWRVEPPMPSPVRYHTATYVDNIGVVVLGGQVTGGAAVGINSASILNGGTWTTRPIGGETAPARWGHSAVLTESGQLYIYGGLSAATGPALNDVYALDTKNSTWVWRKIPVQAEPRAFHTSTLLPDNTILHLFGTAGAGVEQAVASFSSFNPSTNSWKPAMSLPAAVVADTSPVKDPGMQAAGAVPPHSIPTFTMPRDHLILAAPAPSSVATKTNAIPTPTAPSTLSTPTPTQPAGSNPTFQFPPGVVVQQSNGTSSGIQFNLPTGTQPFIYPNPTDTSNNPNSPNFKHPTGEEPKKNNTGLIAGVSVAAIVVLVVAGLLFQRYRRRSGQDAHIRSRQNRSASAAGTAPHSTDERGGKGGAGGVTRSFTIRKPASVNYVDDDGDLDQTGHPRFKSDSDAHNHPYYGERTPGLVEYELSDTSGQKYGPSSVAERKRYVEQQQRKVMEEYEMSFQDYNPPSSPYPQSPSAPSYTSHVSPSQTPTMGGRSPRIHHQQQHQGIQQQYGGYNDSHY